MHRTAAEIKTLWQLLVLRYLYGAAQKLAHAFAGRVPSGGMAEPDEIARFLKDWEDRDTCRAMINWYRGSPVTVPAMDEPYDAPPAAPFPKLNIPTLVVWALDDVALPPCNLDGIDELVPDVTIVEVPGCGHFVPWEAPDAVNAAMDAFLGQAAD